MISHRITSLMQADCIIVMDKGEIQQMGTHEELIHQGGPYKDIYEIQMNSDIRLMEGGAMCDRRKRIYKNPLIFPSGKRFSFPCTPENVLIMVIVMNILCSVVDIIMPPFQRQAIDSFIEKNTLAGLGGFIALYIAVIVFQMWSVICFTRGCMTLDVETGRDMKRALFVHLQKLSFSYYNATPVGYILSRVMNDVARITELIAWDVIDMLWPFFM